MKRSTLSKGWIEALTGGLGGGKSYSAVADWILPVLASGGTVCTNMLLDIEGLREYLLRGYGWGLDDKQIIVLDNEQVLRFHAHTPSGVPGCIVLCVIDEAHLYLPTMKSRNCDEALMEFLTQARKCDTRCLFISQDFDNVAIQVRRLVQNRWKFRDLRTVRFGFGDFGWHLPFPIMRQSLIDPQTNKVTSGRWRMFDKDVFACYTSKQLLKDVDRLGTAEQFQNAAAPRGARTWLLWLCVLGLISNTIYSRYRSPTVGTSMPAGLGGQPAKKLLAVGYREGDMRIEREEILSYGRAGGIAVLVTGRGRYRVGFECPHGVVIVVKPTGAAVKGWGGEVVMVTDGGAQADDQPADGSAGSEPAAGRRPGIFSGLRGGSD